LDETASATSKILNLIFPEEKSLGKRDGTLGANFAIYRHNQACN
jgi:hypothetical protein